MNVFEIDLEVPYDKKGEVIRKLAYMVRGKVKKAKLLPPDMFGRSRIILDLEIDKKTMGNIINEIKSLSH
ncbi:hypothetical protein PNA2_1784 [Pyrococcus sp. NA2]|uniref:hypothetical protein n=1 Tax=Pyrococcus sp. (strain NA2) TaxID=342949 RepID=UPI000209AB9F|nr:hypothetical protein [Pyrococcus sp. NA2]AEC52698.1 hypothetical protein PNA2_1784 [Pyrococcus sp. NA2]